MPVAIKPDPLILDAPLWYHAPKLLIWCILQGTIIGEAVRLGVLASEYFLYVGGGPMEMTLVYLTPITGAAEHENLPSPLKFITLF